MNRLSTALDFISKAKDGSRGGSLPIYDPLLGNYAESHRLELNVGGLAPLSFNKQGKASSSVVYGSSVNSSPFPKINLTKDKKSK